jgi:predicted DCC family thiol-disulfide oxidoreductase YuxK
MRPIQRITVLYDPECGFCCRCASWLQQQPARVWLYVMPQGPEVWERFPGLRRLPKAELTVIDDRGGVYFGDNAWILCLWALREWSSWAHRLARPNLRPLARDAFELVSHNRGLVSGMLGLKSDAVLAHRLQNALPEDHRRCEGDHCGAPH